MVLRDTPIGRDGGGQDEKLINSNFLRPAAVNISALTAEMQLDPQKTSVGLDLLVGKLGPSTQSTFGSCR